MMRLSNRWLPCFALCLATVTAGCDNPVEDDDHGEEAVGVRITDTSGALITSYANGNWTFASGDAIHLHPGEDVEVRIFFVAADGDLFQLPPSGEEHTMGVVVANPAIAAYHGEEDQGHFEGIAVGQTSAIIQVVHGGHEDFETRPGVPIEVVDDDH